MSGWRNLASEHPFSFLKSGAAPFFTRISRYFLFLQKGCWVRRFFWEAQSLPKLRVQSAFGAQRVSTKRGRDLRHAPPNPPPDRQGTKKKPKCVSAPPCFGPPRGPRGPRAYNPTLDPSLGLWGWPWGRAEAKRALSLASVSLPEGPQSQRLPNAKEREKRTPVSLTNRSQGLPQTPEAK